MQRDHFGAAEGPAEADLAARAHEFTHALVHTLSPRMIPTWLNEGLASALEADDITWATSAVAVHRLLDEIGGAGVANLIRDLGEGADFDQAFAHRAQEPFNDFIARLAP